MKNIRQSGQALILVLILLAVGTLIVVPTLSLASTSILSSKVVTERTRLLYAADAMQEYVMWKLLYDTAWRNQYVGADGATGYLSIDLCGIRIDATVVMRAVPGQGGITLATDDKIRPTKTVSASNPVSGYTDRVANRSTQTLTYIIRLEQLSNNTTQGLDAIYDILPKDFGENKYVAGSSYIRVDGGNWQPIGDPSRPGQGSNPSGSYGGQERLRWPYSGNFSSPIRDFDVRQVKELKFQLQLTIPNNADDYVLYNYAVIKVGNITTFSGPQAPLTIGAGDKKDQDGMLTVTKASSPSVIMPGAVQDITYTINVSNNDTSNHDVTRIIDYLPPEFFYVENSSVGFGNLNPAFNVTPTLINGVPRQILVWTPPSSEKQVNAGTSRTLSFVARTTKDVSGSYYNEVLMESNFTLPAIYSAIGVTLGDFTSGYSWNSGTVIVPAYDSSANASGVVVDSNLALRGLTSMFINSYQIR